MLRFLPFYRIVRYLLYFEQKILFKNLKNYQIHFNTRAQNKWVSGKRFRIHSIIEDISIFKNWIAIPLMIAQTGSAYSRSAPNEH